MKLNQFTYSFLSALLALGLTSCGTSSKNDQNNTAEEFKDAEGALKTQIEQVVYNIPSPTEIPYLIQATGAEFNESLLNTRTKVDEYTTHNDKAALNIGVYAADIGYLSSYEKTQKAIDYLNTTKTLADHLDVIGTFDVNILKRFETNISNKDSLTVLLDQTIKKTEAFLNDNKRTKLSALIVAGSFIEGLHISTGLVKSYPRNILPDDKRNLVLTPIIRVILEQRKSVSELLKMMKTVEQTEPVTAIVGDLESLERAYTALNIEEQIKNNHADLILTDKNLEEITKIVEKLRASITQ